MKPLPGLARASVALLLALQTAACSAPGPGDSIPPFTLPALDGFHSIQQQRQFDVLICCECWDEREELKDKTNCPFAQIRTLVAVKLSCVLAINVNIS